jgi:gluconokinase
MKPTCTIALDLGTSAFKAAWVDGSSNVGPVTTIAYKLDYNDGHVTCPPERYLRAALRALRGAAKSATTHRLTPSAIGITSQAQTFVTLNNSGKAFGPAVVWLDATAAKEAEEAAAALPDFIHTSGFAQPSTLQFLPKVMRCSRAGENVSKFLLLNEWLIQCLTGQAFGDTNSQGMGGFWDVSRGEWNPRALELAGVSPGNLARVGPAGELSAPLSGQLQQELGLSEIPVFSCGNDQSCAAIGAGLEGPGDLFCNFGTALVVYGLTPRYIPPACESQIAGVSPWPDHWFLLGVESECGNVLDWLAKLLFPRAGVGRVVEAALLFGGTDDPPQIRLSGGGQLDLSDIGEDVTGAEVARAVLELYSERFRVLLAEVSQSLGRPNRIFVGGGLSRSQPWLRLLEQRHQIKLHPCGTEHPGLRGVAKIIGSRTGGECGTPL